MRTTSVLPVAVFFCMLLSTGAFPVSYGDAPTTVGVSVANFPVSSNPNPITGTFTSGDSSQVPPSATRNDISVSTSHAPRPQRPVHRRLSKATSALTIALILLGAGAGLVCLVGLLHCLRSYCRTPRYDAMAAAADRTRVQREIEVAEQELTFGGAWAVLNPPPPPYFPSPESVAASIVQGYACNGTMRG
ncbi:hypothetical protein GGX14DRAFT_542028 [Mycena pura]|uniref:Uncharacterized protein n=1 Tax=Mycena pura TaxID=153505 RepID=A0AAD6VJY1_9AGAR|nr:hypothetical protein GGX14DRAFT_542028 [Mycena pura]